MTNTNEPSQERNETNKSENLNPKLNEENPELNEENPELNDEKLDNELHGDLNQLIILSDELKNTREPLGFPSSHHYKT